MTEEKRPLLQPIGVYVADEEHAAETVEVLALSERALAIWFFAADARIQNLVDEQTGTKWGASFDAERTRVGHSLWLTGDGVAAEVRANCIARATSIFAQSRDMKKHEVTL